MATELSQRFVYTDVTNTIAVPFTTGIQRVTKELLRRFLATSNYPLAFHPLVYSSFWRQWRTLTKGEQRYLLSGSRKEVWRSVSFWLDKIASKLPFRPSPRPLSQSRLHWIPGSLFLDIDSSWHAQPSRSILLPQLQQDGIKVSCIHYDLTPLTFPEYAHPQTVIKYADFIASHLKYSNLFLCISKEVARDLRRYQMQFAPDTQFKIRALRLGADHFKTTTKEHSWANPLPKHARRPDRKFLLSVGTLEPRKNFTLLLDVFDDMAAEYPWLDLIIVGRAGWKSDELQNRLRMHPLLNQRIFWLQKLTDASLADLYTEAFLVVIPSFYEGFGLPVAEALHHGAVVLSSDRGALPEVGGELALYFDPTSQKQLNNLIRRFLMEPSLHSAWQSCVRDFRPLSWDHTAKQIRAYLTQSLLNTLGDEEY